MAHDFTDRILITLRRIIRAVDLHSRALARRSGLTGPQALIVREVVRAGEVSVGDLARAVSLSQATVTDVIARLEVRGALVRRRASADKRRVLVTATPAGRRLIAEVPSLMQERFVAGLRRLEEWEQTQLLASLQRVAAMMHVGDLNTAESHGALIEEEPLCGGGEPVPLRGEVMRGGPLSGRDSKLHEG